MSVVNKVEGKNIFDIYLAWDRGTSANGRPINELESSEAVIEAAAKRGVVTEQVACPYSGSRFGVSMNNTALIDMALSNKDSGVINGLAWINSKHLPARSEMPIRRSTALDITNIGVALALYVSQRAERPYAVEGEVPNVIANITKASKGLQAAVGTLYVDNPDGVMPKGKSLYEYVEKNGMLVREVASGEKHGCAAPEKMFIEAADALYSRVAPNPKASILEDKIEDFSRLRMFGDIFFVSMEQSLAFNGVIKEAIAYALHYRSNNQRIAIADYYKRKEDSYLEQCAQVQRLANLALSRDPLSARQPATADLQRWLGKDSSVINSFLESPKDFLRNLPR